jgi:hypothetical protein
VAALAGDLFVNLSPFSEQPGINFVLFDNLR